MQTEGQNMRACAEYADRLVDLSDGDLPDGERQSVESHLATCAGCRAELARLDASLSVLRRTGFQPVPDGTPTHFVGAPVRATYYAAALSLLVLLAAGFAAVYFARNRTPETAQATPGHDAVRPPKDAGPIEPSSQPAVLDEAAALRQIALIEQQARLQASLDLMPMDPWFAEQRAANEELLATFKAAAVASAAPKSREEAPAKGGSHDNGETL
jgi:anti-sigma factor RsiW